MVKDFIILLFFVAAVVLAGKNYVLKKQLKFICRQLHAEGTRLVTVDLVDRDIESVTQEINELLGRIEQTVIKSDASSKALKSSIADISHDMKTPLTSVIGYLQLAKKECTEEKIREMITICLERTRYCNELINNFFELSLLESQDCTPDLVSVDITKMLCEQILASHPIFEEKGITPHFEDFDKAVVVSADFNMMNRVIQNLISNSVKYTSGDIYFRTDLESGKGMITISNPVSEDVDVTHIFDRFYTQDKSRNSGSGIGLYLCKRFVEAMGGRIWAEMEGERMVVRVCVLDESNLK